MNLLKHLTPGAAVAIGFALTACATDTTDSIDRELAFHYAPVHFQDTDDTNAEADFITRIDYDGNWFGTDNWDNLGNGDLSAAAYYSIVESRTHWFIVYAFFHPRDWTDHSFDQEHENDLEGLLAIVRKDGSVFGDLQGVISVAHLDFFSYVPSESPLTDGQEDIDGELTIVDGRMRTSQEAKGHGLKAWPHAGDFSGAADEDGVIYVPCDREPEVPDSGNDRSVCYRLVDLFSIGNLWFFQLLDSVRDRSDATTFASWGVFKGDESGTCGDGASVTCKEDAANAPWGWDDRDDGATFAGEMAIDPAHLVDLYFDNLGSFGHEYVRNEYLETLCEQGFGEDFLPRGWPDQLDLDELYDKLPNGCPS